jgi:hypothetical protein
MPPIAARCRSRPTGCAAVRRALGRGNPDRRRRTTLSKHALALPSALTGQSFLAALAVLALFRPRPPDAALQSHPVRWSERRTVTAYSPPSHRVRLSPFPQATPTASSIQVHVYPKTGPRRAAPRSSPQPPPQAFFRRRPRPALHREKAKKPSPSVGSADRPRSASLCRGRDGRGPSKQE